MKKNKKNNSKYNTELAKDMEANFIDTDNYLTKVANASNPSFQSSTSSESEMKSNDELKKKGNSAYRLGRS